MIAFTEEMREALAAALTDRTPCLIGTADAEGWPNISYRGSVAVYDDSTLSIWSRGRKDTVANIEANPRVVVFYRNRDRRALWRFYGRGTVVTDPAVRDAVIAITPQPELDADPERKGVAVLVSVERIVNGLGEVLQQA